MGHPIHGWGFCGSEVRMPEELFRKLVASYISIVYYAGVAMVGKKFPDGGETINVDAWKIAFDSKDVTDAMNTFYCDGLPLGHEVVIEEEIKKHPLKGIAPAQIPLSSRLAQDKWHDAATDFAKLEDSVETWAMSNLEKIPNAPPNFGVSYEDIQGDYEGEGDESW